MLAAALVLAVPATALGHPDQHGPSTGHLHGSGAEGDLQLIGRADLTDQDDRVADVGVDPRGTHAYVADWGDQDEERCSAPAETGGITDPDAGVFVVDIGDLTNPRQVGFIPASQDSRPGEGIHAVDITTAFFDGVLLVTNNEQWCGGQGRGGVSLYDVTDPTAPTRLAQHFGDRDQVSRGDANDIHSAFAWDTGAKAYVVTADNFDLADVDILDITNPRRPRLIAEYNLNTELDDPIMQPALGLQESFLHDMVVKRIGDQWVMLLSYWDGGFVRLDVTNPLEPKLIHQTDYPDVDPELADPANASVPSESRTLPPEGNAHQAEFTADNRFFIGTDEDFSPSRGLFEIASGPNAGRYPAGEFGWTPPMETALPDKVMNGPTVYGGYGCPGDRASIPEAGSVFPFVAPGEERIIVFQRGPVDDPSAPGDACFFSEKVESGQLAGYDAVVIANHHVGAHGGVAADAHFCGGQGHEFEVTVPAVCIGHRAMHLLFGSPVGYTYPEPAPAPGQVGERISVRPTFDGWGYVWLFDAVSGEHLDTFAVDEAHDPAYAYGFGDLTVHEVATDPNDASRAYLSYYSAGLRSLDIQCPGGPETCELVETGRYLDHEGNDFWGVEAFTRNGATYVLASDRDDGLYVFSTTRP